MKRFNVVGNCIPEEDYMVDISGKLNQIKKLIDAKQYFTINKARQYGKTTTLYELAKLLPSEYHVAHISFQDIDPIYFESSDKFSTILLQYISNAMEKSSPDKEYAREWNNQGVNDFNALGEHITIMCRDKKVVLMIDEVDNASSNSVFVKFLDVLREKYIKRRNGRDYTFHSVILASVYDIKNLKIKMINDGSYSATATESSVYNSPWNIASNFNIDMSFSPSEIATMLQQYENDNKTGMDITKISGEIYSYTCGYPFMVSRICQCIDEELHKSWNIFSVKKAVNILLSESNTLFDDVFKNLENNKELHDYIYDLLIMGVAKPYVIYNTIVSAGVRYGYLKKSGNGNDNVTISNKIFELFMTDYYIAKGSIGSKQIKGVLRQDIVKNGKFDMELCLRRFADHYKELYNKEDAGFYERHGRLLFLSYLKPLINGQGFYHIESQFTDLRRMDIVVDFSDEQFIIELKIWRGAKYEDDAYKQLLSYMESKKAEKSFLLTFDFRKEANIERKMEWVDVEGKKIFSVNV